MSKDTISKSPAHPNDKSGTTCPLSYLKAWSCSGHPALSSLSPTSQARPDSLSDKTLSPSRTLSAKSCSNPPATLHWGVGYLCSILKIILAFFSLLYFQEQITWGRPVGTPAGEWRKTWDTLLPEWCICLLEKICNAQEAGGRVQGGRAVAVSITPCDVYFIYFYYILRVTFIKPMKFQLRSHLHEAFLDYVSLQ